MAYPVPSSLLEPGTTGANRGQRLPICWDIPLPAPSVPWPHASLVSLYTPTPYTALPRDPHRAPCQLANSATALRSWQVRQRASPHTQSIVDRSLIVPQRTCSIAQMLPARTRCCELTQNKNCVCSVRRTHRIPSRVIAAPARATVAQRSDRQDRGNSPVENTNDPTELTLPQACLQLGMRWHRAYALMCSGALGTPRKVGGQWRVPADGVAAYLARTAAQPSASAGAA